MVTQQRKSTLSLRKEARELEAVLAEEGFEDVRRLAKQLVRLELHETLPEFLPMLKRYQPDPLVEFLEKCGKIVNVSKDIKLSIDIITRIIHALKLYSRLDQAKVEEVDLHEGIETTLIILQNQIKHGIEVNRKYGILPTIPCYANELNQVWTNIIHNALQAMNGNGILTIETFLVSPAHGANQTFSQDSEDEKIVVKISDTGPGIPNEIQDKIFDPYFTTKDQGEGSGLGLGIAQHIVERHRGEIRVTSKPGETSFEVILPATGVQEEYLAQS
jgi:signal transduction histidine kinase